MGESRKIRMQKNILTILKHQIKVNTTDKRRSLHGGNRRARMLIMSNPNTLLFQEKKIPKKNTSGRRKVDMGTNQLET
jgi:hypothetical protein